MPNYWFWENTLNEDVLPALRRIYEFHVQQIVPALKQIMDETPGRVDQRYRDSGGYANEDAGEQGWEDAVEEQLDWRDTLRVYSAATCEALYYVAAKFILLLYRREIISVQDERATPPPRNLGELPRLFLEKGIDLKRIGGYERYELLRLVSNCHKHVHGESCQELERVRPDLVRPNLIGLDVAMLEPDQIKDIYEGIVTFLKGVIDCLNDSNQGTSY